MSPIAREGTNYRGNTTTVVFGRQAPRGALGARKTENPFTRGLPRPSRFPWPPKGLPPAARPSAVPTGRRRTVLQISQCLQTGLDQLGDHPHGSTAAQRSTSAAGSQPAQSVMAAARPAQGPSLTVELPASRVAPSNARRRSPSIEATCFAVRSNDWVEASAHQPPSCAFVDSPFVMRDTIAIFHARLNPRIAVLVNTTDTRWPGARNHRLHEGHAVRVNMIPRNIPLLGQGHELDLVTDLELPWIRHLLPLTTGITGRRPVTLPLRHASRRSPVSAGYPFRLPCPQ
jgi:hypothetical protein